MSLAVSSARASWANDTRRVELLVHLDRLLVSLQVGSGGASSQWAFANTQQLRFDYSPVLYAVRVAA